MRSHSSADLSRKLKTADDVEAARLIERLVVDFAMPVVRQTVKRRFASARKTTTEEFEDVCAEAISGVIVRLHDHRAGGSEIIDLEGYAASVASNTADRFFAARAPQRARLRNRIRYLMTTCREFEIQESEAGIWNCGLRGKAGPLPMREKQAVSGLRELVRRILSSGPMDLSDLTTRAADTLGISDHHETLDDHADSLRDPAMCFSRSTELRDWLTRLWDEVRLLPSAQSVALLLNLGASGTANNGTTLCAIADLGIAKFGELAATLGMAERQLSEIWNRVPLKDQEIAERLGLERQQVVNLRASARQRLERRMKAIDNAGGDTNTEVYRDTKGLSQ